MPTLALPDQRAILISVADYVTDVLGDNDFVSLPFDRAEAILQITKNQSLCYIQFPSEECPELTRPLLWNYGAWSSSIERYRKSKERSERERVARWIADENVRRIKKAVLRLGLITDTQAQMLAYRMLINPEKHKTISALNVTLITKESEL